LARKKSDHLNAPNGTVVFSYPPASRTNPATRRHSSLLSSYTCLGILEKLIRYPRALNGDVYRSLSGSGQKAFTDRDKKSGTRTTGGCSIFAAQSAAAT
jgi:hypothetical protein